MKFIATSDWHVRASSPKYRVDEYSESILNKIGFIVRTANKNNCPILVAGDIFHNIRVGTRIINKLTRVLKKCKNPIYAVPGQHDLEHHAEDLTPTPFLSLIHSDVITHLGTNSINNVYGLGWGEEPPKDGNICTDDNSILVLHYCTTPGDPAFFLEDNALSAEDILKSFPEFKIIITGDYHTPHVFEKNGRLLINPGCIGRSNKDQKNFQPVIYLVDTEAVTAKEIKVPVRPSEEVFKIPENEDALDKSFSDHIEQILKSSTNEEEKPDFITTVRRIMKKGKYTKRQMEIAEQFYN